MSIHTGLIVALALMTISAYAVGQQNSSGSGDAPPASDQRSTPAPALSGILGVSNEEDPADTNSTLPQIPAAFGGAGLSLALTSEQTSNTLRGGVNVGAAYDDNALLSPTNGEGNTSFSVYPNIAIEQSRSRVRWNLGYAGGLTVNQRLSSRNQGSHNLYRIPREPACELARRRTLFDDQRIL
jgi:hypothetical protein